MKKDDFKESKAMQGKTNMRIAICEDNKEHADILHGMIHKWADAEGIEAQIGHYESAEQFMCCWEDDIPYDLVFLDIEMAKMNGMELAQYIRRHDRAVFLVFTTGFVNYALKGYEVTAFRYLKKPLQENKVFDTLKKALHEISEANRDAIIVPTAEGALRVFKNDIYYVEVDNHYIIMHTKQGNLRYKEKLGNVEPMFPEPAFCKCHRSYIVNLFHVGKLTRDKVEVDNGDILPVSRARWDDLNECYLAYYMKR